MRIRQGSNLTRKVRWLVGRWLRKSRPSHGRLIFEFVHSASSSIPHRWSLIFAQVSDQEEENSIPRLIPLGIVLYRTYSSFLGHQLVGITGPYSVNRHSGNRGLQRSNGNGIEPADLVDGNEWLFNRQKRQMIYIRVADGIDISQKDWTMRYNL